MGRPAKAWRNGGIDIAAWQNDNGVSFTTRKTYKDKTTNEYKESRYFYLKDLKAMHELLTEVIAWAEDQDPDRAAHKEAQIESMRETKQLEIDDEIPF
jgi:hypothetical protein